MLGKLQITHLAFVILARNHNPSLLNPDFLRINKIVNTDWAVTSPTFTTDIISQVVYKNGVTIIIQSDKISFEQLIEGEYSENKVLLQDIALRYLEVFPHINYEALEINPKGHIEFQSQEELDHYISDYLLRPGDWKNFLNKKPSLSATFIYSFEDSQINISIDPVLICDDKKATEKNLGILFAGNIYREFNLDHSSEDKLKPLNERVSLWSDDVNRYISLVNDCLLNEEE
ncbi:hypothetical protein PL8927_550205 [Planktothrix serta PCC 8927]|uniref:TIGR04255 family protein n=1 Tax=Planktothrix serta PCC 8927 TaxID=671068 RepID=A0A7Z9BSS7_9CYAN|nr:hypothetical protein [Planktothrix serta]VXD17107.1 hypothetical protein PL8927_550205 [Planktothrix serta PCC 8927]